MDNNYNNNYNNDYNYNNYNQGNGYPPQDRKGMAIASLILGIISIPLGCCAYLGVIPGIIAVFSEYSVKVPRQGIPAKQLQVLSPALSVPFSVL